MNNIFYIFCVAVPVFVIGSCVLRKVNCLNWFSDTARLSISIFPLCVGTLVAVYNIKIMFSKFTVEDIRPPVTPAEFANTISNSIWAFEYGAWSTIVSLSSVTIFSILNRKANQTGQGNPVSIPKNPKNHTD